MWKMEENRCHCKETKNRNQPCYINCTGCNKVITYTLRSTHDFAEKHRRTFGLCSSCNRVGELNPFFGKTHKKKLTEDIKSKVCATCKIEKTIDLFYVGHATCKACHLAKKQKWRKDNPEEYKAQNRRYNEKTKDIQKEKKKIYRENNRETYNAYWPNRKKVDVIFKLLTGMRSRVSTYMKKSSVTKNNKTFEIVGCTPQELKDHLEKHFKEGMTWENYGLYGWHIDHIIPLASANTEDELLKLFHYTNLQPLWAEENLLKSNKITPTSTNNTNNNPPQ
jgi:hypothetical protein